MRSAQTSFESYRRAHLPRGERHYGECDVRIGRYCYWRGDEGDEKRPDEPRDIAQRRDELLRALDSAATALPGDAWIAGQYVRYLVEAEKTDEAIRVARSCRADAWWCSALAGFAAHAAQRFAAADSAYGAALRLMPDAERCRWMDISDILEDDMLARFKRLDCAARPAFVRRVLWLGAPLLSIAPTDLYTEHLTRLTRAKIAEGSATTDGERWADDQRDLVMRYGWPRWYTRAEPPLGSQMQASVTGHDDGMPYNYIPSVHVLDSITQASSDDWHLNDPRATLGYAPAYARTMHDLTAQVAAFRRGDSTLVVASWNVEKNPKITARPVRAGLVVAESDSVMAVARVDSAKNLGRLSLLTGIDSGIVSVEVLTLEERRAARMRVGLPARKAGVVTLSDLLLYSSSDREVVQLGTVMDSALAGNTVPRSRSLGVFWEAYGIPPQSEPVKFTLTIEQVGSSWTRRLAERLHLSDPSSAARIQWQEVPRITNGVAGRGVKVDLSRLRGGRYRVELTVAAKGAPQASAAREIVVR